MNRKKKALASTVAGSLALGGFALGRFTQVERVQANPVGSRPAAVTTPSGRALPSFASLAAEVSPTVVYIKVVAVEKTTQSGPGFGFPPNPFGEDAPFPGFRSPFPTPPPGGFRRQGSGSGFIIRGDGVILTNNHVVEDAKDITVTLTDKREFSAKVLGRDPKTDLAVLKIEPKGDLPVAKLGDSQALQVGDWVMAIGNPFGLSNTVTAGIVSAKGRVIGAGPYDDFIQTDAPINPGNSGGPLFNMNGEMVGINTAIIASGQGIGFAIPADLAKPLIPKLVSTGGVTRGYLGVSIQSVTPELAKAMKLDERQGALVSEVVPSGPAAKTGIRQGDVIVGFNDELIKNGHDLPALVAKTLVGEHVTVTLRRDGKTQKVPVTIGKLPAEQGTGEESSQAAQSQWGLQLQDVTPQMARQRGLKEAEGVMVVGVQPGSPAERAGLQRGDAIREVNRQAVQSVQEVRDAIAKADNQDAVALLVKRNQGSLFVAMAK